MSAKTKTIVLADDHRIVREGLCVLLKAEPDFSVIGAAGDGLEALEMVRKLHPDVAVLVAFPRQLRRFTDRPA
ncbi:MAG: response regulator transcription factor [Blastocatellia bacterium]